MTHAKTCYAPRHDSYMYVVPHQQRLGCRPMMPTEHM